MARHQPIRLCEGLRFPVKGANDQQAFQPLLQEYPQRAVRLLDSLVEPLEHPAEQIRQQEHRRAARHEDDQEPAFQPHKGCQRAGQPHQHAQQAGHNLGHAVCDDDGIRGQAVHPFAGMSGCH